MLHKSSSASALTQRLGSRAVGRPQATTAVHHLNGNGNGNGKPDVATRAWEERGPGADAGDGGGDAAAVGAGATVAVRKVSVQPKVHIPFEKQPGRAPRRVEVERRKREYAQQNVGMLMREAGVPAMKAASAPGNTFHHLHHNAIVLSQPHAPLTPTPLPLYS